MGKRIGWIVVVWALGHAALVGSFFVFVFLYSVVRPGLADADYQAFANAAGPWFSIVVGVPVFYGLGRLLKAKLHSGARRAATVSWLLYSVTDLAIVLAAQVALTPLFVVQWCASQGVKWVAIRAGAGAPAEDP